MAKRDASRNSGELGSNCVSAAHWFSHKAGEQLNLQTEWKGSCFPCGFSRALSCWQVAKLQPGTVVQMLKSL